MKFSMLAIAGAAIAAGVEGFSAVRTNGVRQVSGCCNAGWIRDIASGLSVEDLIGRLRYHHRNT